MVEFPTSFSNCALVVMFIHPWEIQLVWKAQEVRMSKPAATWSSTSKREMEALMRAVTPAQTCGLGGAVMTETRSMGGAAVHGGSDGDGAAWEV
ncbi:hypothetical protein M0R45_025220 [Rubus argutus]|uniref:Uncharacterized protein n=1 Tax=Rubus argutus TaxID=59490 RepID=A0AAW1WU36_RUBAR